MILDTLIHILSVSLAVALLGTLLATVTYYVRYKMNSKRSIQISHAIKTANFPANAAIAKAAPLSITVTKKRLHFRTSAAPLHAEFKETVS